MISALLFVINEVFCSFWKGTSAISIPSDFHDVFFCHLVKEIHFLYFYFFGVIPSCVVYFMLFLYYYYLYYVIIYLCIFILVTTIYSVFMQLIFSPLLAFLHYNTQTFLYFPFCVCYQQCVISIYISIKSNEYHRGF